MKLILTTILSFVIVFLAHAQNFELVGEAGNIRGDIGEKITAPVTIQNTSEQQIQLVIKRIDVVIGTGQANYFCWNQECYDQDQDMIIVKLAPGETARLESILEAGLMAGFSTVRYLIYERSNSSNAIEHEFAYTVEDESAQQAIFSSDDLRINDIYPNPIVDFAIVDYNLLSEEVKAKIIIHNVLGSIIGQYELTYLDNSLKINTENFNPGVYFYTLYLDNEGVMTKKLIIRK